MAYDFEQAKKYLSDKQIETYLKQKGANELKLQPQSQFEDKNTLQQIGGGLKKAGEFVGDITGISGVGEGFREAGKIGKALIRGEQLPAPSITPLEFAGEAGKVALTAATFGGPGLAAGVAGKTGLALRSLESGLTGAAFQILDNLSEKREAFKDIGVAGGIAASIPIAGAGLRAIKQVARPVAQKIEMSLIKPTAPDLKDGFKIENIRKYKLEGPLQTTLKKAQEQLDDLSKQLSSKIKQGEVVIDLNEAAKEAAQELLSKTKAKQFGEVGSIRKAFERLGGEVEEQSTNGLVGLPEGQAIKQAAGKKGAWVFGFRDPDSTATEAVYTNFYRALKKQIEKKAPEGIKEINQKISELIPIVNAIIRRIPIAERQNAFTLTDVISGGFAIGDPKGIGLFALNRLSKSGSFAKLLSEIESKPAVTSIGKRIFGTQ